MVSIGNSSNGTSDGSAATTRALSLSDMEAHCSLVGARGSFGSIRNGTGWDMFPEV
jgi:hypothetical protein